MIQSFARAPFYYTTADLFEEFQETYRRESPDWASAAEKVALLAVGLFRLLGMFILDTLIAPVLMAAKAIAFFQTPEERPPVVEVAAPRPPRPPPLKSYDENHFNILEAEQFIEETIAFPRQPIASFTKEAIQKAIEKNPELKSTLKELILYEGVLDEREEAPLDIFQWIGTCLFGQWILALSFPEFESRIPGEFFQYLNQEEFREFSQKFINSLRFETETRAAIVLQLFNPNIFFNFREETNEFVNQIRGFGLAISQNPDHRRILLNLIREDRDFERFLVTR